MLAFRTLLVRQALALRFLVRRLQSPGHQPPLAGRLVQARTGRPAMPPQTQQATFHCGLVARQPCWRPLFDHDQKVTIDRGSCSFGDIRVAPL